MRRSIGKVLQASLAAVACCVAACTPGGGSSGEGSVAAALVFSVQPPHGMARSALSPAIQIRAVDARGRTVASETRAVTLSLRGGTSGATLGGTLTVSMVDGLATFPDLAVSRAGTGYTLAAACTGLSSATSGTFDVTPALLMWGTGSLDEDLWQ